MMSLALLLFNTEWVSGGYAADKPYGWAHGGDHGFAEVNEAASIIEQHGGALFWIVGKKPNPDDPDSQPPRVILPTGALHKLIFPDN